MSFLDNFKASSIYAKAFKLHQDAIKISDNGKPAEAKAKYTEALKLYGEVYDLGMRKTAMLSNYAVLLMREGQLEKARDVMLAEEKIKGLSKEDWRQLRINYSIYQWKSGQIDKAIETIRRAADVMNGTIYNMLGMYLTDKAAQTGEYEEALAFNKEAMDYDDEDASTLDNMAQLYMYMSSTAKSADEAAGYRAQAITHFKKAYNAKPKQITSKYYLAKLLHEDGEDEKARKVLSDLDTLYVSQMCPVTLDQLKQLKAEIG